MTSLKNYKYLTLQEVSEIVNITRRTLYNYIKAGKLEAVKVGKEWRVTPQEVERFLKHGTR